MTSPWRTVQQFISAHGSGVFEVALDTDTKDTRCTCPVWNKRGTCKHTTFVKMKMMVNQGHYSIRVSNDVSEDLAIEVSDDPEKFREFIIKYGKIEVL